MAHIKLKASKEHLINFDPEELNKSIIPEDSKKLARNYINSEKLAEDDEMDVILMFKDRIVYGFDYLHKNTKRMIVEINPVTIFYSNAVMSAGQLQQYKELLLAQAPDIGNIGDIADPVNPNHTGMYFQLAINCIINLQAALESFANRIIPNDYQYLDKDKNLIVPTIAFKLNNAIPIIKSIDFHQKKYKKYNISIDHLIKLRNHIIHLKPSGTTSTGYKGVYRDLLNFDYVKAILAVKTFINFYEDNLIEECQCGNDFFFYSGKK